MHKPEEYGLEETQKFIALETSEPKIVDPNSSAPVVTFNGLSKNDIIKYGSDPFWVKLRWTISAIFGLAWIGMLTLAILIVVFSQKCPYQPKQQWYDREVIYQLDVVTFKDSDGDGKGDLNGLIDKLDKPSYFDKLGTKVLCLNDNWLDSKDPKKVQSDIGNDEALKTLKKKLEDNDMNLMLDIEASALQSNDTEILTKWLTGYADGIRVTKLDKWQATDEEKDKKLSSWIKLGEEISEKTFKPKMITFYPYSPKNTDSPKPRLVISQNLLDIKPDDLKTSSKLIAKIKFPEASSYILDDSSKPERIRDWLNSAVFRSTYHGLVLLLKGTPFILYGDELEYTKNDKVMKWDKTPGCGFTTNNKTSLECTNTVKHASAYGSDKSLLKMYERLIKLRTSEPSFKWGDMKTDNSDGANVVSYVREADRFDGFLILGNLDNEKHLVDFKQRHSLPDKAKIEYYYAADGILNSDFVSLNGSTVVHVDNLHVKPGDFMVLRFNREESSSDSESSSGAGVAHG